ncbi:SEC-C metal-binding domain-containing protein [Pseudomonas aeruginosa]
MRKKLGRNDPCPCGSGRKLKKCHGSIGRLERLRRPAVPAELQTIFARHEAHEFQRREQQGLGKPIISSEFHDHRLVAVGQTIYFSQQWKTFHDFLKDYPKMVLGRDWWISEASKPPKDRHRILSWAICAYEQARAHSERMGPGVAQPMTGAISSYMRFAYDLYGLKHANEVQQLLIDRIKCPENFPGALYEVRVAAALLRAGFTLQPQDETDRRTTHVEFIATHEMSGAIYTVEAKRRKGRRMKINRQMHRALCKHSDHPRIVFIDTNDGRLNLDRNQSAPVPLTEAENLLNLFERDPSTKALPQAYVIITYDPDEHHLDAIDLPSGMLLWGFHLGDLKLAPKTLRQQVDIRQRHAPIFALLESMQKHRHIPATFDGVAEAYLNAPPVARLQVGQRVDAIGPNGTHIEAVLESGAVIPQQKSAVCVVRSDDHQYFTLSIPLSDEELRAYAEHPATFFGVIDKNASRPQPKTGLDWFDFFWEAYSNSTKEKLIELMANDSNLEGLRAKPQEELATAYCVRMAELMMGHQAEGISSSQPQRS